MPRGVQLVRRAGPLPVMDPDTAAILEDLIRKHCPTPDEKVAFLDPGRYVCLTGTFCSILSGKQRYGGLPSK